MAYVSFESFNKQENNQQNTNTANQVGFFSLKNDGEEAIVRFMYDSVSEFEILGTHQVSVNGKFRRVNCLRSPSESLSACPICNSGKNIEYKFYIRLLQYTKDSNGSIVAEPKVWERSMSYANKLKEYINNYGPLSDVICKVIRHGKPGEMTTEYEIIPNLSKQIYRDDIFVKKLDCFNDFKVLGRIVLDKSFDDINTYVNTGNFPVAEKQSSEEVTKNLANELNNFQDIQDERIIWSNEKEERMPWEVDNSQTVNKPVRFY